MIAHFIKRDFKTYKLAWNFLIIGTVLFVSMSILSGFKVLLILLGYLYFFFGLIPYNNLIGVTWRSQHIMSRNYLLSLPIKREKLFHTIQLRAFIYWLPFLILQSLLPLIPFKLPFKGIFSFSGFRYVSYLVFLLFAVLWLINMGFILPISMERITSYLTQKQRFTAHLKLWLFYMLEFFLMLFTFKSYIIFRGNIAYLLTVMVILISIFRSYYAKKLWLYHQ